MVHSPNLCNQIFCSYLKTKCVRDDLHKSKSNTLTVAQLCVTHIVENKIQEHICTKTVIHIADAHLNKQQIQSRSALTQVGQWSQSSSALTKVSQDIKSGHQMWPLNLPPAHTHSHTLPSHTRVQPSLIKGKITKGPNQEKISEKITFITYITKSSVITKKNKRVHNDLHKSKSNTSTDAQSCI